MTTIAVFLPLVFVKGIAGQLFKDQALTVTFTLLVSLFIALTLVPMLMSLGSKKSFSMSNNDPEYQSKTKIGAGLRRGRKFIFNNLLDYLVYAIKFAVKIISLAMRYLLYIPSKFINIVFNGLSLILLRLNNYICKEQKNQKLNQWILVLSNSK